MKKIHINNDDNYATPPEFYKKLDEVYHFDFESEFVNATDMAKIYGERPVDFLKLSTTKAFIEALKSDVSQNHIDF